MLWKTWRAKVDAFMERANEHLQDLLDTPEKSVYAAINGLYRRAFGKRRLVTQYGVKTLEEIGYITGYDDEDPYYFLQPAFVKAVALNTRLLERAIRSGPVEFPDDCIIPINRQIRTYDRNINIQGFGADSVIRVYPGKANPDGTPDLTWGQGFSFDVSAGRKTVKLHDFKVEMHGDFQNGEYIQINGYAVDRPSNIDFQLSRQNIDIFNVFLNGSNAYTSDRPWSNGTRYGLKLYNPNYASIYWVQMQGNGIRNPEGARRNNYGIYIESTRGGYECLISSCKIHDVEDSIHVLNPIPSPGNFPYGQEGMKIELCTFVNVRRCVVLLGDTYGAPGWDILFCHGNFEAIGVYVEQMRQGRISGLWYCSGFNGPGVCAYFYLNRSASDWEITGNKCYWQGAAETQKSPRGVIVSGGYIPVLDRFEFAVANNIHHNLFVGKPGGGMEDCWFQDGAIQNFYQFNRRENMLPARSNLPQNVTTPNSPTPPIAGGIVPVVHGELVVDEVPVLDAEGEPLPSGETEFLVLARKSEGAELVPFTGKITACRVASGGEIVLIDLEEAERLTQTTIQDPTGYILDLQWAQGTEVDVWIRDSYYSAIDYSNPAHPVAISSPFEGKNLRGFAVAWGVKINLHTDVPILLKNNVDLLPLTQERDIMLLPQEVISFRNGRRGIEQLEYRSVVHLTETRDNLLTGVKYLYTGRLHPYPLEDGKQLWIFEVVDRYIGQNGGRYERLQARNIFANVVLECQVVNDSGWSDWSVILGPVLYTEDAGNIAGNQNYLVAAPIFGKSLWHLDYRVFTGSNGVKRHAQIMLADDNSYLITRTAVGDAAYTPWQRVGAKMADTTFLQNSDFTTYIDTNGNLQLSAKSDSGTQYDIITYPVTVGESVITGGSFLLMYDNSAKRWYKITQDDEITIIRRVTDSIYLRRDNIPTVASFTANHKQIRYDITTGQLVRLA